MFPPGRFLPDLAPIFGAIFFGGSLSPCGGESLRQNRRTTINRLRSGISHTRMRRASRLLRWRHSDLRIRPKAADANGKSLFYNSDWQSVRGATAGRRHDEAGGAARELLSRPRPARV